ncbi:mannose-1-phosphate guanylyltransferase [Desulfobotulus alkaliphilus]|uniref:Mannose-1-phosphate guanylyltransferase n=1 Tax=Desulfobotulus alkaliphilus TaxID=622671 RepID=A0A562S7W6_9BACT|nr:nucleotidyltransferase family protein [Desulfobotulus alkaliphilus]TWI77263.1 mannose-1-phosphate guanylyltransferase [Desulfobotulus alkaliphilus]
MKAFLLAAGLGTRLRPLTNHTPKCMVTIGEKPLLGIWLNHLALCGIREVLINTHHLADRVADFLDSWPKDILKIHPVHEPFLLGSAGTLLANRDFIHGKENFLIVYADNLCNYRLSKLLQAQQANRERGALLTMALFKASDPSSCGIAELDATGCITGFEEKPEKPVSNLANAGIYAASPEIFTFLKAGSEGHQPYDIGQHLLPRITGKMYGLPMEGYLRDIGTPESLEIARREWRELQPLLRPETL